jgi:hypothetical protein
LAPATIFRHKQESPLKYLLVTSDDFGMTHSINRGIEEALQRGVVGATNLMVPCPWFSDAARRAREGKLPAGIHLTLTCEWDLYRWRPLTESPHLRALDGGMHRSYAALPESLEPGEIRAEFEAQLAALRLSGVEPTHVDTHMMASASVSPTEKKVKAVVESFCADHGLIYTYATRADGSLRYFETETHFSPLSEEESSRRLSTLGEGIHHLISHCAIASEEQRSLCSETEPGYAWAEEYRVKDHLILTSPAFRNFVERLGFVLLDMRTFLGLVSS